MINSRFDSLDKAAKEAQAAIDELFALEVARIFRGNCRRDIIIRTPTDEDMNGPLMKFGKKSTIKNIWLKRNK